MTHERSTASNRLAAPAMVPCTDDELKRLLLGLLVQVDSICRAQGIPYYLYAGTLLGAVRHGGFIPWDDDLDIMMERDDYERFCEEFPTSDALTLVTPQTHPTFPYACSKVSLNGTRVAEEVDVDADDRFGISVDVLPFDAVSDRAWLFRLQVIVAWLVRALLLLKVVQPSASRPWHTRLMLTVTRALLSPVPVRALTGARARVAMLWRGRGTEHRAMLIMSVPWRVPASWISPATEVEFEGRMFPAPADTDGLLTAVYGDYRTPPPPARRNAPHRARAYRMVDAS